MGRRFTTTIWGLPWTAVLVLPFRTPKKHMVSKATRRAYGDGVADGVSAVLNKLEIPRDPEIPLVRDIEDPL